MKKVNRITYALQIAALIMMSIAVCILTAKAIDSPAEQHVSGYAYMAELQQLG